MQRIFSKGRVRISFKVPKRSGYRSIAVRCSLLLGLMLPGPKTRADMTLLIESPINFLGHVSSAGHAALLIESLCSDDHVHMRWCHANENGTVASRYKGIGAYVWVAMPPGLIYSPWMHRMSFRKSRVLRRSITLARSIACVILKASIAILPMTAGFNSSSRPIAVAYSAFTCARTQAWMIGSCNGSIAGLIELNSTSFFQLCRFRPRTSECTEDEHFRKAIAAGVNIVHINTELRVAWRKSLAESLADAPNEVVPYKLLRPVVDSVKKVIGSRLRLFHGEKLRPATIVGVV